MKAIAAIDAKIIQKKKSLDINIDQFLLSNRRIDRDKVIKKRESILTLKELRNELLHKDK